MISINYDLCYGCGVCAASCPSGAISMDTDNEGFRAPKVTIAKCRGCNTCKQVCPIEKENYNDNESMDQRVYACQTKRKDILIEATAGGFFPTLAEMIIDEGGIVYGATFNEKMIVVHKAAFVKDDIKLFYGSKYIQSNIENVINEIRNFLREGKTILFSGTPCQVDSIKTACKNISTGKLFTVDVICYGVPSPGLFRSFLNEKEKEQDAKVIDYRFRDKHQYGWSHTTVITYEKESGKTYRITEPDYSRIKYYNMFGRRDCYRRSCYHCNFNKLKRCSDITTGNFWGIENISNFFQHELGVSMVIINTKAGLELFKSLSKKMFIEERTVQEAISSNEALVRGSSYTVRRDKIYESFSKNGFEKMYKKYYGNNLVRKTKKMLRHIRSMILIQGGNTK